MQLTVGAVHLAFQCGIDSALLLDTVLAAEAFVDDHGRHMHPIGAADLNLGLREGVAQQFFDFMGLHGHPGKSFVWFGKNVGWRRVLCKQD